MARQRNQPTELQPIIRRARLEQVIIYEVSESELELLAHGFANSTYLNFAIGLLSAATTVIKTNTIKAL